MKPRACQEPAARWAEGYRTRSEAVAALRAPEPPLLLFSPNQRAFVECTVVRYPRLTTLSEPMERLAGLRFNPLNRAVFNAQTVTRVRLRELDGAGGDVAFPSWGRFGMPRWSPDGSRFALSEITPSEVNIWVVDARSRSARRITGLRANGLLGSAFHWMADSRTLVAKAVPQACQALPDLPNAIRPRIEETTGGTRPISTYEARDVLRNQRDEDLFEHYALSQLCLVDVETDTVTALGDPEIYARLQPAPGGRHLYVETLQQPFSRRASHERFAKNLEIRDLNNQRLYLVGQLPVADQVPIGGVRAGPRNCAWHPTAPAMLVWTEALDDGDPERNVTYRDRLMALAVPDSGTPNELCRTEKRCLGALWGELGDLLLVWEWDRAERRRRIYALDVSAPRSGLRLLWDVNEKSRYGDPGTPVMRALPNGHFAIQQDGDGIFKAGLGASPLGSRPFLDRIDLRGMTSERLFQCPDGCYEQFAGALDLEAGTFVTRRESASDPPNFFLRSLPARPRPRSITALTNFNPGAHPLAGIKKQIVTCAREDGATLSFAVYTPASHDGRSPLPALLWAYPDEHSDARTAGEVRDSAARYLHFGSALHLFVLLSGYAVLDEVSMPVIGSPDTAYDSFIEQTVANAKTICQKVVELGLVDRGQLAVGGHSHGALMATTLLAHCDLFRAGIAICGAYNHTLRPFGFQSERRTLWQAPSTYLKLSPLMYADRIKRPLLLIHGEIDGNPGTPPLQSELLFEAIRGTGGVARLVMLPFESHSILALESTEHTIYEMTTWLDQHVKAGV